MPWTGQHKSLKGLLDVVGVCKAFGSLVFAVLRTQLASGGSDYTRYFENTTPFFEVKPKCVLKGSPNQPNHKIIRGRGPAPEEY